MNDLIKENLDSSRAEFDIQIMTAKRFPRDVEQCKREMISMATSTQEIAESCYYMLPRAGKEISGASIRLAEIAFGCWGNMHIGKRIIGNDGTLIKAEAVCWDLQKNVKINTVVDRSIKSKNGQTYSVDMQVVTGNAAASIALRNALFAVIPKSIIDEVYVACRKAAVGESNLFLKRRKQVFERFNVLGVKTDSILNFFEKDSVDAFTEENLADLIGVGTSIREGLLEAKNAFELTDDIAQMDVKSRIECLTRDKKPLQIEEKE